MADLNQFGNLGDSMSEIVDNLSKENHGITLGDALDAEVCVMCSYSCTKYDFDDVLVYMEYITTGLCKNCQGEFAE